MLQAMGTRGQPGLSLAPMRLAAVITPGAVHSAQQKPRRRIFNFRHFTLESTGAAMKMGTDSMLLGSWARPGEARQILDVGTGSGVLALMAAQRSAADAHIHAIDIDLDACHQAAANARASAWAPRVQIYHMGLQDMLRAEDACPRPDIQGGPAPGLCVLTRDHWCRPQQGYDMIVSNPPYFINGYLPPGAEAQGPGAQAAAGATGSGHQRALARHAGAAGGASLTYEVLVQGAGQLLAPGGRLCVVLPADEGQADRFTELAAQHGLQQVDCLHVFTSTDAAKEKRRLMCFQLRSAAAADTMPARATSSPGCRPPSTAAAPGPPQLLANDSQIEQVPSLTDTLCKRLSIYQSAAESGGKLIGGQPPYTHDYMTLTWDFHQQSFFDKYGFSLSNLSA